MRHAASLWSGSSPLFSYAKDKKKLMNEGRGKERLVVDVVAFGAEREEGTEALALKGLEIVRQKKYAKNGPLGQRHPS